jgi:hypothetical protein
MTSYYRLVDDESLPGRWYLRSPIEPTGAELDPRVFLEARAVDVLGPLRLPLRRPGTPLDFTLADFDMPVARRALAERLAILAPGALQLIPVTIAGQDGDFVILNLLQAVRCLDERATTIQWWQPEDGRPEKVGQYRMVLNEVIDPRKVGSAQLFRLGGWEIAVICTDAVKRALDADTFRGLAFRQLGSSSESTRGGAA